MLYVFVDANIFIRVISQGRPGCELEHFTDLVTLARGGVVRLLVPEILTLELEKHFRQLPRQFESECDKLMDSLTKATSNVWNEIDALKVDLLVQTKAFKQKKISECERLSKKIMEFVTSQDVVPIPLTNDIWLDTQRRLIAGRMPRSKNSSDQDAGLISSLASFFLAANAQDARLIFCSENVQDFAVECKPVEKDRVFALDPLIQDDLPNARYFVDLASALEFAKGYESFPIPDDEQIQHAANLRDLHDFETEEYEMFEGIVREMAHKKAADHFRSEFVEALPEEEQRIRAELGRTITGLLKKARATPVWDDHSEYKLPQWIEYVPEEMLPYTSIPKMVRIKRSLEEYLHLHTTGERSRFSFHDDDFAEPNSNEFKEL